MTTTWVESGKPGFTLLLAEANPIFIPNVSQFHQGPQSHLKTWVTFSCVLLELVLFPIG